MKELLLLYSGIITVIFVAIWRQNNLMFKEVLKERQNSQELRKTILNYLKK